MRPALRIKLFSTAIAAVALAEVAGPAQAVAQPSGSCFRCESWYNGSLGVYQHNDYQLFLNNLHGVFHSAGWIGPCAGGSGHFNYGN